MATVFTHPTPARRDAPFHNLGRTDARTKLGGMCVLTHMGREGEKKCLFHHPVSAALYCQPGLHTMNGPELY